MKEALFYKVKDKEKKIVQCELCPWNCTIKDNSWGICGARKNIGGKLYSMTYSKPAALNIDPIEKKPLYHFLPGTSAFSIGTFGCNLFCLNCQNFELSRTRADQVKLKEVSPEEIVKMALESGCESIAYTYNEPTVFYEYAIETMKLARKNGIKNVWVSNGYINEKPLKHLVKYLDGINVDLKFFNEENYRKVTRGSLKSVLRTIKFLGESSVWLELTNLIIPGYNDDESQIREMIDWISRELGKNTVIHFSRFFPMYKMQDSEVTPIQTLKKAHDIASEKLKFVYVGNIGPNKYDNTYCPKCGALLIERIGFDVVQNNIVGGKCKFCGEKIPGVWG